jgi:hypothetical protein
MLSGRSNILQRIAIGGKTRRAEPLHRRGILRFDPGERPLALDLFEPQVRIIVRSRDRGPCVNRHDAFRASRIVGSLRAG